MTYEISKNITIRHTEENWKFSFSSDDYGTVTVLTYYDKFKTAATHTDIPKECIQHFIDALKNFL